MGRVFIALGGYKDLKNIKFEKIRRFVFVCRGNVCRSPYAEAAVKALNLSSESCGVDVKYSAPAEEMAVEAARLRGLDLSGHMSRSIHDLQLDDSDCLVAMDPSHLRASREIAEKSGCQVTLVGLWCEASISEIQDPYGKPLLTFCYCFDMIDEALVGLTAAMKKSQGINT